MTAFLTVPDLPSLTSVPDDALIPVWASGTLYAAPKSSIGSGGGGGGSGYQYIENAAGTQLTQRDTVRFAGLLVSTDAGGRTVVTMNSVALASQVSGVLPIANGGTGLSALGTPGQSYRVAAGGTSLEFYTPSAGLTAPSNPGDNGKVAVASAGNLSYTLLTTSHLSPTAGITLTQHANMATDRLLGRDTAGSGAPEELTVSGGIEFTGGGGLQRSALSGGDVTAPAGSNVLTIGAQKVTRPMLANAAAKGQSLWFGDSSWQLGGPKTRATDLNDANATLVASDGARAVLPAGTLTAARVAQFSLAGATEKLIYAVERYDLTANTYTIQNSLGVTIYTFLAGVAVAAVFQYTSGEWVLVSHFPLV